MILLQQKGFLQSMVLTVTSFKLALTDQRPLVFGSTAFEETKQRSFECEKGLSSLAQAVKQDEKIHQEHPVQTREPFNLLECILKGDFSP